MATAPPDFISDTDMPDFISDEEMAHADQAQRGSFGLGTAESIGATPFYQSHRIPGTNIDLPFSMESAAEALPAAVAGGAALLATKNPGAAGVVGGIAGEAGRQLLRRAMGAPQATGVAQRALDLDPNSPEAAAAGLGGEAVAGLAGAGASKVLGATGRAVDRSSRRSVLNILQPGTQREKAEAMRLARVAQDEGLVPPLSTRADQILRAKRALGEARGTSESLLQQGTAAGQTVDAGRVLDTAAEGIPSMLPGGGTPRTGQAVRRVANQAASDAFDAIAATGGGGVDVPLAAAVSERRRLDDLLRAMYEAGREQAPVGTRSIQDVADAWRGAISDSFPELGAANLRQSDLIAITHMMEKAAAAAERTGGAGTTIAEAGAVGAGAVGRMSVPAMVGARALVTAGPFASLSAAGKRVATKLLEGGAQTAQLWTRAADLAGLNTTTADAIKDRERNRRAHKALQNQAEGVVAP